MFWSQREIRLRNSFARHFSEELFDVLLQENRAWEFIQFEGPQLTPINQINPNYTNDDVWMQEHLEGDYPVQEFFKWMRETDYQKIIDTFLKYEYLDSEYSEVEDSDDQSQLEYNVSDLKERLIDEGEEYEPHRPWVTNIFDMWMSCLKKEPTKLVLRPETTPSSYVYARHLLDTHSGIKPPYVVWQTGKSFRREQDQVTKNMRLKEFYQQEFQCIYTTDTKNDYQEAVLEPVRKMIGEMVRLPTRLVESDRLPSYSLRTMDVEVWCPDKQAIENAPFEIGGQHYGERPIEVRPPSGYSSRGRWMEVCSISKRTDFPGKVQFQTKKGIVEKDLEVLEVAIGLDRCVYNFEQGETN